MTSSPHPLLLVRGGATGATVDFSDEDIAQLLSSSSSPGMLFLALLFRLALNCIVHWTLNYIPNGTHTAVKHDVASTAAHSSTGIFTSPFSRLYIYLLILSHSFYREKILLFSRTKQDKLLIKCNFWLEQVQRVLFVNGIHSNSSKYCHCSKSQAMPRSLATNHLSLHSTSPFGKCDWPDCTCKPVASSLLSILLALRAICV